MPVKFSAPVKNFDVDKYLDQKEQRKMDLFMQYGMAAAIDAVDDSGMDLSKINLDKVGVSIGSGIGGLSYIENTKSVVIVDDIEIKAVHLIEYLFKRNVPFNTHNVGNDGMITVDMRDSP